MKGYDIIKKSALRAGINDCDVLSEDFSKKGIEFLNQIANDLKISEIVSLSDEIILSKTECETLCCGVAMLISLDIFDSEKNSILTNIYNSKRSALLSNTAHIEDVLPKP